MTDPEKFLKTSIEQTELFYQIKDDIKIILKNYGLEKRTDVIQLDSDTIAVEVQEEIPSKLISDLNDYFGFPATVTHDTYNLKFKYNYREQQQKEEEVELKKCPFLN